MVKSEAETCLSAALLLVYAAAIVFGGGVESRRIPISKKGSSLEDYTQYWARRLQGCGGLSLIAPMVPLSELPRRRQAGAERAAPAGNATTDKRPAIRSKRIKVVGLVFDYRYNRIWFDLCFVNLGEEKFS